MIRDILIAIKALNVLRYARPGYPPFSVLDNHLNLSFAWLVSADIAYSMGLTLVEFACSYMSEQTRLKRAEGGRCLGTQDLRELFGPELIKHPPYCVVECPSGWPSPAERGKV